MRASEPSRICAIRASSHRECQREIHEDARAHGEESGGRHLDALHSSAPELTHWRRYTYPAPLFAAPCALTAKTSPEMDIEAPNSSPTPVLDALRYTS